MDSFVSDEGWVKSEDDLDFFKPRQFDSDNNVVDTDKPRQLLLFENFPLYQFKTKLPTSLNVALTYPYKQFMFYEQHNLMKKHMTSGFGISYKYEVKDQGTIFGKAGYFVDEMHNLTYPTFGLDLKYDRYFIGMSYIYGDETLPVSNTFRLTINLEI